MHVIEQTAPWQELSHHVVLIVVNAHSHIQNDAGMQEFVDDLHLFNKVSDMLVPEPFFLDVLLDCNFLTEPFSQIYLTIAAFSNGFDDVDLLFGDEEV